MRYMSWDDCCSQVDHFSKWHVDGVSIHLSICVVLLVASVCEQSQATVFKHLLLLFCMCRQVQQCVLPPSTGSQTSKLSSTRIPTTSEAE